MWIVRGGWGGWFALIGEFICYTTDVLTLYDVTININTTLQIDWTSYLIWNPALHVNQMPYSNESRSFIPFAFIPCNNPLMKRDSNRQTMLAQRCGCFITTRLFVLTDFLINVLKINCYSLHIRWGNEKSFDLNGNESCQ